MMIKYLEEINNKISLIQNTEKKRFFREKIIIKLYKFDKD